MLILEEKRSEIIHPIKIGEYKILNKRDSYSLFAKYAKNRSFMKNLNKGSSQFNSQRKQVGLDYLDQKSFFGPSQRHIVAFKNKGEDWNFIMATTRGSLKIIDSNGNTVRNLDSSISDNNLPIEVLRFIRKELGDIVKVKQIKDKSVGEKYMPIHKKRDKYQSLKAIHIITRKISEAVKNNSFDKPVYVEVPLQDKKIKVRITLLEGYKVALDYEHKGKYVQEDIYGIFGDYLTNPNREKSIKEIYDAKKEIKRIYNRKIR
mgnify:CR=1 FL=1